MNADSSSSASHSAESPTPVSGHEWLSALADGDAQALGPACAAWRDDEDARRSWHAYHLIGDVMRTEDLASAPARDAAFMAGLRERLAREPVVLAPGAAVTVPQAAGWHVPVAMAAGFVVVAGVLLVARMGPTLTPAAGAASVEMAAASGAQGTPVSDRQTLIVDPRLQEFLRVHQATGGGMAAAAPGGALRRVDLVVPVAASR